MSVAVLLNAPRTDPEWEEFVYHNWVEHQLICDAVQDQQNVLLPMRAIYEMPEDYQDWLVQHQVLHSQAVQATGVPSFDFRRVDFSNKNSLEFWISQHYQEHLNLNNALGI